MCPPSVTQAAPGAFAESVTNVRILSWLLLGALHATQPSLPVPIECSQQISDYIHFVLAGFADQSKVVSLAILKYNSQFVVSSKLLTSICQKLSHLKLFHSSGKFRNKIAKHWLPI
ncbi:unnamed protein product [Anisakis simplex]|uniref:Uncoordinated protein 79 (inferred by orthology to a C. elegans protein) n=1 Tax=Anisakis simplex TaxID=6269 RepID=A0A0M3JQ08_ANISI|nr:unnamed protein product [Anisakis simplex]